VILNFLIIFIFEEEQHWRKWSESCICWHYCFEESKSAQFEFTVSDSYFFFTFEGTTALGIMVRKLYPMALWIWRISLSSFWIYSKRFFHFLQFWRSNCIGDNGAKAVSDGIMTLKDLTQLELNLQYAILPLSAILQGQ